MEMKILKDFNDFSVLGKLNENVSNTVRTRYAPSPTGLQSPKCSSYSNF